MSFDIDPTGEMYRFPCPECDDGEVTINEDTGLWECNHCSFAKEDK